MLFSLVSQRSNSDVYCFQCVPHYGEQMAIKNMCTNHSKNTQRDTNLGIGFVTTLSVEYNSSGALQASLMAASGGSVLALSRGCQQLLELSGLRPMWLPAIVPDLVLPKIPYKRQVGITDVSYKQQRKYRCKVNPMWSRPLQYCQRLSRSWS